MYQAKLREEYMTCVSITKGTSSQLREFLTCIIENN